MTKRLMLAFLLVFPATQFAAHAAPHKASFDRRPLIMQAMVAEMNRSMKQLKMDGFDLPYFVAMEMKSTESFHIRARYGALYKFDSDKSRRMRVEVRVGSYAFDNIGTKKSDFDFSFSSGYHASSFGPVDDDPSALRNTLWLMTDSAYKAALKAYLKRKSKKVTEVDSLQLLRTELA